MCVKNPALSGMPRAVAMGAGAILGASTWNSPAGRGRAKNGTGGAINERGELVFLEKRAAAEKGKFRSHRKYCWQSEALSECIDLSVEHK